jgi:hypothetical protein
MSSKDLQRLNANNAALKHVYMTIEGQLNETHLEAAQKLCAAQGRLCDAATALDRLPKGQPVSEVMQDLLDESVELLMGILRDQL